MISHIDNEKLTEEKIAQLLADLEEHGNYEIQMDGSMCYVCYMMNDAVEDYLILTDCQVIGRIPKKTEKLIGISLVTGETRPGLRVRETEEEFCTIWFTDALRHLQCYDQSRILHHWVTHEEHFRRLVYMIATMHDKIRFHPDAAITSIPEANLAMLMEFRPFYYWSPIDLPLDPFYHEEEEGVQAAKELVREAGEEHLIPLINRYASETGPALRVRLARKLMKSEKIYRLLKKKVEEACSIYPARSYGEEEDRKIEAQKKRAAQRLTDAGWQGAYPIFQKGNFVTEIFEEHPFTVLDDDDLKFSLCYMLEEYKKRRVKRTVFDSWKDFAAYMGNRA